VPGMWSREPVEFCENSLQDATNGYVGRKGSGLLPCSGVFTAFLRPLDNPPSSLVLLKIHETDVDREQNSENGASVLEG
jgi:hypothetical protein